MSVRVKICGVTNVADAVFAVECGADLIGLNFYQQSPRCVSQSLAEQIRAVIPAQVWCVGVFVNAEREYIASLVQQLDLQAIQLHGDETAAELQGWSCPTIKALRVLADAPLPDWRQISSEYLLLDTHQPGRYGGTGTAFAWERVAELPAQSLSRLILAGGLTPDNVATAVRTARPWGVDVATGVESAPGRKDPEKVRAFITNAKTA